MPKLVLPYNQIADYLKCHHRTFVQQLMKAEAEIHSRALGELPKSSWRVGGVRIWAKRSRPWWGHPLKQFTWANWSSPTPAGQGRNQHRTNLLVFSSFGHCLSLLVNSQNVHLASLGSVAEELDVLRGLMLLCFLVHHKQIQNAMEVTLETAHLTVSVGCIYAYPTKYGSKILDKIAFVLTTVPSFSTQYNVMTLWGI